MRLTHWLALMVLCLLSGSRWLVADILPATLSHQALHFALLVPIFALTSRKLPDNLPKLALLSALLLAFPLAAFAMAEGHVTPYTQTVIFALVPVVAVFVITQQTQGFGPDAGTRRLFIPSLAGILGIMLLIPATLPASIPNQLRFGLVVAAMLASSLAAISLFRVLAGKPILPAATVVSAACAVVLGLLSPHGPWRLLPPDFAVTLLLDAPTLLLTLYLLRGLHPILISTRFLLIPLVTILEGIVLLRPRFSVTPLAGVLLMVFAVTVLLRYNPAETA